MKYSHIKRVMSAALLLAFMAPSGIAPLTCSAQSNSDMTLSGNVRLVNGNDKITLSLRDSDVKQVLRMFADKAGMNIVFHSSVDGKVTLDLVNMPINDAFALVLQIAGLNYYTQNNTLIVLDKKSPDNAAFSKQEMMVFPVKYVSAAKIANFLNKNVFGMKRAGISGIDAATVNSATNEIIIFGMKSDAPIVEKVIAQFDREPLSKTFAVNHTTPAEMANMICSNLFPSTGVSDGATDAGLGGNGPDITPTPGMGTITGGAASTDSGSGSDIKLGEGVVACTVSSAASGSGASPFDLQNLSVAYYTQRGTISVLGGSAEQQRMIEQFIKANDVKQPQAYLEVSIVELNETGSKEFQNNWAIDSRAWKFKFDSSSGSTSLGRQGTPGAREFVQISKIQPDGTKKDDLYITGDEWYGRGSYITWQMQYIISSGKGRVLANPKLLITNGQESVVDLTQDYVEKVTSEYLTSTASGSGATGAAQKTYTIGKDKGIKVTLTPFISPDGYVTMNIKPDYVTEAGSIPSPGATNELDVVATLMNRRKLDLKNVRVKDGETLVVGGLIQESDTKTVYKLPVLGDLPVIGAAFRGSSTRKTKTELVIMLTPHIINDGEGSVADSL